MQAGTLFGLFYHPLSTSRPLASVGDAIDLFGQPIFSYPRFPIAPFSFCAQISTTSPLKRKAPTELEMHSKPYMLKVRCSFAFRGRRFKKTVMAGGGRIIEPAVSFGTPNRLKGLRRPFLVQTSESQAVSWNIDFYAETKMNITSGPTMTRPFLVLSRQQKFEWHRQSINIFFVALLAAMN